MNTPTRWNPLRSLSRFDPITDFDDMFRGMGLRPMLRELDNTPEMRMDVDENDKAYVITVDVPGVKKEDIEVSIEGNNIAISAEVKREKTSKDAKEIHSERYEGRVFRAFTLPHEVDSAKAEARYESGVLSLTLPKKASTKVNRLAIN